MSQQELGPEDVLAFWFGELTPEDWFRGGADLDGKIARRFRELHLSLAAGIGPAWRETPQARLACIVALDQFPRNIYRGTPLAFATDGLARREARLALEAGAERQLGKDHCCFLYLPFEHSEDLADQDLSVALFEALDDANYHDYAVRHRDVIRRFGRFPHRNAILGRDSTAEEKAYLQTPGAGF